MDACDWIMISPLAVLMAMLIFVVVFTLYKKYKCESNEQRIRSIVFARCDFNGDWPYGKIVGHIIKFDTKNVLNYRRTPDGYWQAYVGNRWRPITYRKTHYTEFVAGSIVHYVIYIGGTCRRMCWDGSSLIDELQKSCTNTQSINPPPPPHIQYTNDRQLRRSIREMLGLKSRDKSKKRKPNNSLMKSTLKAIFFVGMVILAIKVMIVLIKYAPAMLESYLK